MFRSDSVNSTRLTPSLFVAEMRGSELNKGFPNLNAALFYPSTVSVSSNQGSKNSYFTLLHRT